MPRKLFCEISPFTYRVSTVKERLKRYGGWFLQRKRFAKTFGGELPVVIYTHKSLIRRQLANVDLQLQENKAVNLGLAAPKISGITIAPGEVFSFWKLVGNCTKARGYKDGLTIANGKVSSGVGGGMCQFTNLLHWMVLHTSLTVTEYHHHNRFDLFPDFSRQIPFGTGTSILYNYMDYQFCNNTENTYQLVAYTTPTHLCGEIRALKPEEFAYHVYEADSYFAYEDAILFRNNRVMRKTVDKRTGKTRSDELLIASHSKVMYDYAYIDTEKIRK